MYTIKELREVGTQAVKEGRGNDFTAMLKREIDFINYTENNMLTFQHMIDTWVENFRDNLFDHIHGKETMKELDYDGRPVLCVGAGPSVKDLQLKQLARSDDLFVITVNKITERVLKYRTPDLMIAIHGTEEIITSFEGKRVTKALEKGMKVALATAVSPLVTKKVMSHTDPRNVYWFNASVPEVYMQNVDSMMKCISGLPTFDTGGNVGLCSMVLAQEIMGAEIIGFMGMETCFPLESIKTDALADQCQIIYSPEKGQLFAMTPAFSDYAVSMLAFARSVRAKCTLINLTPHGVPYVKGGSVGIDYIPLEAFLRGEILISKAIPIMP